MSSCQSGNCGEAAESEQDIQLKNQLEKIKNKLLVMSGKGGVGKSSVAAALAIGLAGRGFRVGLLDVDFHGPSIPHMLGIMGTFAADIDGKIVPIRYNERLEVVSIECLLEDRDSAVIWRGPVKHGVIKQFVSDVNWGELDFLVIDSPPGTGDEPLSVAQNIPGSLAVIVTTPQEVALADVRKSINFCRKVEMPILGLIENMNGYVCPHCNQELPLLGTGGGARTAERMKVRLLGSLPFDPRVVTAGDAGVWALGDENANPFNRALSALVGEVVELCQAVAPGKTAE